MPTQIRPGRIILSPRIPVDQESGAVPVQLYVWDSNTSDWVPFTGVGGGGGGGAGVDPVGIKDGTVASQKLAVDSNGRIGINNFPGTQPVSGSVAVSNFPSGFQVIGNVEVMNDTGNPLPVSGSVAVSNFPATQPVSGPLTDTQLRASSVPVSTGLTQPLTDAQLRAAAVPVAIQAADLAALETIQVGNFPASQPVTGPLTDSQLRATAVPVSGPLTDTQLRAAAVPVSLASVPSHAVTGPLTNTELRATPVPVSGTLEIANDVGNPIPVSFAAGAAPTYKGRACGLRNPARVALTQPIFTFWNGSVSKICRIKYVGVDAISTAIKAATVIPALIRFYRCTAAPTNGAIITKAPEDSTLTSDAGIVLRGDASADGTVAASALAATVSGGALTQEYAPRLITAAGYEMFDKASFFETQELIIRPNEGLIVRLEAPANMVATDHYIVNAIWTEE